jgi:hypothetical protein
MYPATARRPAPPTEGPQPGRLSAEDAAEWITRLKLAERACCCPARPVMVAVLPPATDGTELVEMFFCGHHGRACQAGLAAAGALVHQLP